MADKEMWVFRSATIVYRSSWESCWYFNDGSFFLVGAGYQKYRNSPFFGQHRCTYYLNVCVVIKLQKQKNEIESSNGKLVIFNSVDHIGLITEVDVIKSTILGFLKENQ
jgi:hypothetical protein